MRTDFRILPHFTGAEENPRHTDCLRSFSHSYPPAPLKWGFYCGVNWYSIGSHKPDPEGSIPSPATIGNIESAIFDGCTELTSDKTNGSSILPKFYTPFHYMIRGFLFYTKTYDGYTGIIL